MTGGAYPLEIATRGDQSAYGKNRGCVAEGEWLVGRVVWQDRDRPRPRDDAWAEIGFRLELLPKTKFFSFPLAPALPVVK